MDPLKTKLAAIPRWQPTVDPAPPEGDSSGISQMLRGRDYEQQYRQHTIDEGYARHDPLAVAVASQGPLADPRWTGFFQSLRDAGGGRPVNLAQDVERPHGIADAQPWNETDDARLASTNLASPSMNALRRRMRPMPDVR